MTSRRLILLAPALLLLTLIAWAFSSPVGSSPDEDYHLVSIWCETEDPAACEMSADEDSATVPEALLEVACFAFDSDTSAACQRGIDFTGAPDSETERGNFYGGYPPLFHSVLSLFVGDHIEVSVLTMRVAISIIFTALASALFYLLPPHRRPTLVWSWAVTMVPIGLFIVASVNPSTWAIAGVGFGWLALAGFFESQGWRKVGLAALFALSVIMATGSRGDASMYMALAIVATIVLTVRRSRRYLLESILPLAAVIYCAFAFRVSRPPEAITQGLPSGGGGGGEDSPVVSVFSRVIPTLFDIPGLWMGVFGRGWGLGWVDTAMPALVWVAALSCFLGAGLTAGTRADVRKALVLGGGVIVLLAFPTAVLVAAGEAVGENLQPRYLLPLIVLFAGVLFWVPEGKSITFSRPQRLIVIGSLAMAHAVALFLQLSRYVTGFDDLGVDLDGSIEWWWSGFASPLTVWVLGSLSFAVLLVLTLGRDHAVELERRERAFEQREDVVEQLADALDLQEVRR
ncbi:DUF2142 domain-containing protein [Salinibacterium sp. ZJ70]|uniref:DUF2142 domain-containing protein n=1 Tax=Salinibacterium sp. ZJ70 TaxID=2708084 RepID=UPI00141D8F73|nr:DUF2142 domain-containing protein [Salinibacterium sp. ZJ70]